MAHDPISGPISRDELKRLAAAPFGEAAKAIQKHDPLFGIEPGKKIKWKVTLARDVRQAGEAYVMAASEEDAERLAEELDPDEIDWESDPESIEVDRIEPDVR